MTGKEWDTQMADITPSTKGRWILGQEREGVQSYPLGWQMVPPSLEPEPVLPTAMAPSN